MKKIYLLFLLGMMNFLSGQELNIKFPTTPEFKKFAKNIDYPIDLNKGGISYNVPLFDIPFKKNDINFSLNYSSYGVKVGDLSTEFGHDWSLNIPKISREVRGIPDEFAFGYLNPEIGYSTADMADKSFRVDPNNPTFHPDNDITYQADIYERAYNGEYDLQADKFYFNLNGKSGYFMYKDESRKIIIYPFQDLKIYPDLPNSIKIVDTDGTEYHFGNNLASREITSNNFITSWYISKIVNTNNIITFDYENIRTVYQTLSDEYQTITNVGQSSNPFPSNKVYSTNIVFKPIIKNIHYKNLDVNFNYLENDAQTGIRKIDKISIFKNNKEAYSYLFDMSNYTSYDQTNNITTRTFLNKILLKDDKKIDDYYSFGYYNPSKLPGRLSLKLDLWGFYNNNSYSSIIPSYSFLGKIYNNSDRTVYPEFLKTGILNLIKLPTKGTIQIETESNEVKREILDDFLLGNTQLGGLTLYLEDSDDYFYESLSRIITEPILGPEMDDNNNFPTSYKENFILNKKSLVRIRLLKQFIGDGSCISSDTTCPNVYLTGPNLFKKFYEVDDNSLLTLEAGNYSLIVENLSPTQLQRKNLIVTIESKMKNETKKNKLANGLRVKTITHYDNNGEIALNKLYNYNDENGASSGEYTNLSSFSSFHFTGASGEYYSRLNSFPRNSNNFNGILYTKVTEIIKDVKNNSTNKIINNYHSPLILSLVSRIDAPTQIIFNFRGIPLLPAIVYPYVPTWRQSLLKSQLFFRNNDLIKRVSNNYIFTYDETNGKYDYNFNINQSMGASAPVISQSPSEQYYLSKVTTTDLFAVNDSIVTEVNYNYDSPNHLQLTKQTTINSKGEVLTTEYQYPSDLTTAYAESSKMTSLVNLNRVAEPVIVKQKVDNLYVSEVHNKYAEFNGILQKSAVFQKKGEGINLNLATDRKIVYNSYDAGGNITQYTAENGIPVSIIWGYNGQYPIAKIEGASYSEVSAFVTTLQNLSNNGTLVKTSFNNLRTSLTKAMITTYTYQPLIGVTSITGPNGLSEYYKYDEANRLKEIRNDKDELLKTFDYHYKK